MGYVSASQVAARDTGRTFTATSHPNLDQVADYIDQTAAELDGILIARGYAIPIATTATSALKLLEHYNALGAIAQVEQTAITGAGKRDDAQKAWEAAKKMLASGDVELDAAKDDAKSAVRGSSGFPATAMFTPGFER